MRSPHCIRCVGVSRLVSRGLLFREYQFQEEVFEKRKFFIAAGVVPLRVRMALSKSVVLE